MSNIRIIIIFLLFSLVLTSCTSKNKVVQKENKVLERDFFVTNNKKIEAIFLEKLDLSKKGVYMPVYQQLSSQMTIGDDGACYFFRKNEDTSQIVFRKNNDESVLTTEIPKRLVEEGYIIGSFAKYQGKFFVHLFSSKLGKNILTSVEISDGKWSSEIKYNDFDRIIVYDHKFFCCIGGELTVINLSGNKQIVELEEDENKIIIQAIISDKVFYSKFISDDNAVLMCCNLDGTKREKLFTYKTIVGSTGYLKSSSIKFDSNYLYLLEPMCGFTLVRIPMYGGKIEEITETNWFELSVLDIFFVDDKNDICKVDRSLSGSFQKVTKACENEDSIPFYYANNHLMIEGFHRKENDMLKVIWESEVSNKIVDDITMNYAADYYWVTENGKIDAKIEGSGFKDEYYKLYKKVK